MIDFPIEEIPNLRSYIRRTNKMLKRALPYRGFAKQRVSQEKVQAAMKALQELPPK